MLARLAMACVAMAYVVMAYVVMAHVATRFGGGGAGFPTRRKSSVAGVGDSHSNAAAQAAWSPASAPILLPRRAQEGALYGLC